MFLYNTYETGLAVQVPIAKTLFSGFQESFGHYIKYLSVDMDDSGS